MSIPLKPREADKQELDYILDLVSRKFESERAFYTLCSLTQSTWIRFKTGGILTLTRYSWECIVDALFTRYEYMLFQKAKAQVVRNPKMSLEKTYEELKLKHARHIVRQGGTIGVDSVPSKNGLRVRNYVNVQDQLGNHISFRVNCQASDIPTELDYRIDWFDTQLERLLMY